MTYYFKVTKNKIITRIAADSKSTAEALRDLLSSISELTVEQRIYEYQGVLVRSKSENNAAIHILKMLPIRNN